MIEAGIWLQVATTIGVAFGVYRMSKLDMSLTRIHERLDFLGEKKADKTALEAMGSKVDQKLDKDLCGKMAGCK